MKKLLVLLTLIICLPIYVNAANLTWAVDTVIIINNEDYIIVAGSSADSLVVGAASVDVDIPVGSTFTLRSPDGHDLNYTGNATATCGVTSSVAFNGTGNVTITPDDTQPCSQPSSGAGGPPPLPTVNPHVNGTLVLDGTTVFLIKSGQRYGFRDPAEFQSYGYNFGQLVAANAADKALVFNPQNILKAMEGTLALDTSDNRTVYMIGLNGTKRGFVSEEAFYGLGYSYNYMVKVNVSDYSAGLPIENGSVAHPEGSLILDGQTIWWVINGTRRGFESMEVFNTYGFSLQRVVKANSADMALPEGELVKLRDGTLVLDSNTYYIITDSKKSAFSSSSAMTEAGYSLSNVINYKLTNYASK